MSHRTNLPSETFGVLLACPGTGPHVRNNVEALEAHGLLSLFATTFVDHPQSCLARFFKLLGYRFSKGVSRRASPKVSWEKIVTNPYGEIIRSFSSVILKNQILTHRAWEISQPRFDSWAAQQIRDHHDLVYIYEQCGMRTAERAKALSKMVVSEQVSQHQRFYHKILINEIDAGNDTESLRREIAFCDEAHFWNRYRDGELKLADAVFCNSAFTKRTLVESGFEAKTFFVTPLGCPPISEGKRRPEKTIFLHAGTESIRKGTHHLYAAWRMVANRGQAELWFAGSQSFEDGEGHDLPGKVRRFGSIPQHQLFAKMSEASVLVVPTLADGFGMVITEALSRGLPVITTDAAGASDLLKHQQAGGLVIPAHSREALADAMNWCIDHPRQLYDLGIEGREIARAWQWADYRREYIRKLRAAHSMRKTSLIDTEATQRTIASDTLGATRHQRKHL